MTRVILNGTIKGLRGKIGNLIFRQMPDGTTVVSRAEPKKNSRQKKRAKEKRSPRQQEHNEDFADASAHAKQAAKDHPIYAEIAATNPMWTAYNIALKDRWKPPEIHHIKRRKGHILVEATDNIRVAKVFVTVLDEENKILETGDAVRRKGDWWEFPSQVQGKTVKAEAWDFAGNVTRLTV